MINAKEEFIEHTKDRVIKCAELVYGDDYVYVNRKFYRLPIGFNKELFEAFLSQLNFEYHNGYGGQNLFGTIWYEDGTWSSRGEYDGSEWWEHNQLPEIPEYLR